MNYTDLVGGFVMGLAFASLVEYWMHRAMHHGWVGRYLKTWHINHHRTEAVDGWFWEFLTILPITLLLGWLGFFWSWEAGITFFFASIVWVAMYGYCHELAHEAPEYIFWMHPSVHTMHHRREGSRYNFGICLNLWDHVFRTYKKIEGFEKQRRIFNLKRMLSIKWF